MAFSGDPSNVNVHSGGTGKSAYPIADQFVPELDFVHCVIGANV